MWNREGPHIRSLISIHMYKPQSNLNSWQRRKSTVATRKRNWLNFPLNPAAPDAMVRPTELDLNTVCLMFVHMKTSCWLSVSFAKVACGAGRLWWEGRHEAQDGWRWRWRRKGCRKSETDLLTLQLASPTGQPLVSLFRPSMSAQTSIWRIALYEELQAIEEKATADKDTDMERGVCSISNVFVHLPHRLLRLFYATWCLTLDAYVGFLKTAAVSLSNHCFK